MVNLASVVVTGASRGLGLELVTQLARKEGCQTIIAACRHPDQSESLQKLKELHNEKIHLKQLDVGKISFFDEFVNALDVESIDCLINNAGVAPKATRINLVKLEQMQETMMTNVYAPLFLSRAFLPLLKMNPGSLIVNMSSVLGSIEGNKKVMESGGSGGGQYPYRASKAALNMVTRSLSVDLAPFNIGVLSLHPGWVKTDMGGPHAPLTVEKSVQSIIQVVENFQLDLHNGQFLDYLGQKVPW